MFTSDEEAFWRLHRLDIFDSRPNTEEALWRRRPVDGRHNITSNSSTCHLLMQDVESSSSSASGSSYHMLLQREASTFPARGPADDQMSGMGLPSSRQRATKGQRRRRAANSGLYPIPECPCSDGLDVEAEFLSKLCGNTTRRASAKKLTQRRAGYIRSSSSPLGQVKAGMGEPIEPLLPRHSPVVTTCTEPIAAGVHLLMPAPATARHHCELPSVLPWCPEEGRLPLEAVTHAHTVAEQTTWRCDHSSQTASPPIHQPSTSNSTPSHERDSHAERNALASARTGLPQQHVPQSPTRQLVSSRKSPTIASSRKSPAASPQFRIVGSKGKRKIHVRRRRCVNASAATPSSGTHPWTAVGSHAGFDGDGTAQSANSDSGLDSETIARSAIVVPDQLKTAWGAADIKSNSDGRAAAKGLAVTQRGLEGTYGLPPHGGDGSRAQGGAETRTQMGSLTARKERLRKRSMDSSAGGLKCAQDRDGYVAFASTDMLVEDPSVSMCPLLQAACVGACVSPSPEAPMAFDEKPIAPQGMLSCALERPSHQLDARNETTHLPSTQLDVHDHAAERPSKQVDLQDPSAQGAVDPSHQLNPDSGPAQLAEPPTAPEEVESSAPAHGEPPMLGKVLHSVAEERLHVETRYQQEERDWQARIARLEQQRTEEVRSLRAELLAEREALADLRSKHSDVCKLEQRRQVATRPTEFAGPPELAEPPIAPDELPATSPVGEPSSTARPELVQVADDPLQEFDPSVTTDPVEAPLPSTITSDDVQGQGQQVTLKFAETIKPCHHKPTAASVDYSTPQLPSRPLDTQSSPQQHWPLAGQQCRSHTAFAGELTEPEPSPEENATGIRQPSCRERSLSPIDLNIPSPRHACWTPCSDGVEVQSSVRSLPPVPSAADPAGLSGGQSRARRSDDGCPALSVPALSSAACAPTLHEIPGRGVEQSTAEGASGDAGTQVTLRKFGRFQSALSTMFSEQRSTPERGVEAISANAGVRVGHAPSFGCSAVEPIDPKLEPMHRLAQARPRMSKLKRGSQRHDADGTDTDSPPIERQGHTMKLRRVPLHDSQEATGSGTLAHRRCRRKELKSAPALVGRQHCQANVSEPECVRIETVGGAPLCHQPEKPHVHAAPAGRLAENNTHPKGRAEQAGPNTLKMGASAGGVIHQPDYPLQHKWAHLQQQHGRQYSFSEPVDHSDALLLQVSCPPPESESTDPSEGDEEEAVPLRRESSSEHGKGAARRHTVHGDRSVGPEQSGLPLHRVPHARQGELPPPAPLPDAPATQPYIPPLEDRSAQTEQTQVSSFEADRSVSTIDDGQTKIDPRRERKRQSWRGLGINPWSIFQRFRHCKSVDGVNLGELSKALTEHDEKHAEKSRTTEARCTSDNFEECVELNAANLVPGVVEPVKMIHHHVEPSEIRTAEQTQKDERRCSQIASIELRHAATVAQLHEVFETLEKTSEEHSRERRALQNQMAAVSAELSTEIGTKEAAVQSLRHAVAEARESQHAASSLQRALAEEKQAAVLERNQLCLTHQEDIARREAATEKDRESWMAVSSGESRRLQEELQALRAQCEEHCHARTALEDELASQSATLRQQIDDKDVAIADLRTALEEEVQQRKRRVQATASMQQEFDWENHRLRAEQSRLVGILQAELSSAEDAARKETIAKSQFMLAQDRMQARMIDLEKQACDFECQLATKSVVIEDHAVKEREAQLWKAAFEEELRESQETTSSLKRALDVEQHRACIERSQLIASCETHWSECEAMLAMEREKRAELLRSRDALHSTLRNLENRVCDMQRSAAQYNELNTCTAYAGVEEPEFNGVESNDERCTAKAGFETCAAYQSPPFEEHAEARNSVMQCQSAAAEEKKLQSAMSLQQATDVVAMLRDTDTHQEVKHDSRECSAHPREVALRHSFASDSPAHTTSACAEHQCAWAERVSVAAAQLDAAADMPAAAGEQQKRWRSPCQHADGCKLSGSSDDTHALAANFGDFRQRGRGEPSRAQRGRSRHRRSCTMHVAHVPPSGMDDEYTEQGLNAPFISSHKGGEDSEQARYAPFRCLDRCSESGDQVPCAPLHSPQKAHVDGDQSFLSPFQFPHQHDADAGQAFLAPVGGPGRDNDDSEQAKAMNSGQSDFCDVHDSVERQNHMAQEHPERGTSRGTSAESVSDISFGDGSGTMEMEAFGSGGSTARRLSSQVTSFALYAARDTARGRRAGRRALQEPAGHHDNATELQPGTAQASQASSSGRPELLQSPPGSDDGSQKSEVWSGTSNGSELSPGAIAERLNELVSLAHARR